MLLSHATTALAGNNTEFDSYYNFTAYQTGRYAVKYKLLSYSYGSDWNAYTHWAPLMVHVGNNIVRDTSAVFVIVDNIKYKLASWGTTKEDCEPTNYGKVHIRLEPNMGKLVITDCADGVQRTLRSEDGDQVYLFPHDRTKWKRVYATFLWYPPQDDPRFTGKNISICTRVVDQYFLNWDTHNYDLGDIQLSESVEAPTLYDPVFYPMGSSTEGKIAQVMIPYSSTVRPTGYTVEGTTKHDTLTAMAGNIFAPTTDSIQDGYRVAMNLFIDENMTVQKYSNRVTIPAYHQIYDFKVQPYRGLEGTDNDKGYKLISWAIKNPKELDAIPSDVFELQRAYKADFSDAQTITNVLFDGDAVYRDETDSLGEFKQYYAYVDSTDQALVNTQDATQPVYYRVRRASAYTWGWEEGPYAKNGGLNSNLHQAYLYTNYYTDYTSKYAPKVVKDKYYNKNHKVHFTIPIGREYSETSKDKVLQWWDDNAQLIITRRTLENDVETVNIIPIDSIRPVASAYKDSLCNAPFLATFTDTPETPCLHYTYGVKIVTKNCKMPLMTDINGAYTEKIIPIPSEYNNFFFSEPTEFSECEVVSDSESAIIHWETEGSSPDYFRVSRRIHSTLATSPFELIADKLTDYNYYDRTATPGKLYDYKITAVVSCSSVSTKDTIVSGYRSPFGRITGRVQYTNGIACAGVKVYAYRQEGYSSANFYKEPGSKNVEDFEYYETTTADDGSFTFENIPYENDGRTNMELVVESNNAVYECNTDNWVALNIEHSVASNIIFSSSDYARVSGRVLFENSTIPVHHAHFLLNDRLVKSATGAFVETDASGNFELTVPKDEAFRLQAVMDNHVFTDGGKVRMYGNEYLTISKSLDGVRIYDQTKVTLIGRLAGGNIQGSKPLGFGHSTNNLGDDLQFVMELDGDNIAQFVYNENRPDITEIDTTFVHPIAGQQTEMLRQKNRIIVRPDVTTGEYRVEVFPTRYKITQATAQGYSTIFSRGMVNQALDLSNCLENKQLEEDGKVLPYNATYNIIYRADANLTAQQYVYGMPCNYMGEKQLSLTNLKEERTKIPVAEKQNDGTFSYVFGYPVFISGYKYMLQVSGHEDYYYNNDKTQRLDMVMLTGNRVKVHNSLSKADTTDDLILGQDGTVLATLEVDNPYFDVIGEEALRTLNLSVEVNGEYTPAEPIRAYVIGSRIKGNDVQQELGSTVIVNDVLRDPPGSNSYSYVKQGAKYYTMYEADIKVDFGANIGINTGVSYDNVTGFVTPETGVMSGIISSSSTSTGFEKPMLMTMFNNQKFEYSYEQNTEIRTSDAPNAVGSMANVFIGSETAVYCNNTQSYTVIDQKTYEALAPAIAAGVTKIVTKGENADGTPYYLVITEKKGFSTGVKSTFAYTQQHILAQIIPQLMMARNALIREGAAEELQEIANATNEVVYRNTAIEEDDFGSEGNYEVIVPKTYDENTVYANQVKNYNNLLTQWTLIIIRNEERQIMGCPQATRLGSYSISEKTQVSYEEKATYNYSFQNLDDYVSWWGLDVSLAAAAGTGIVGLGIEAFIKAIKEYNGRVGSIAQQFSKFVNSLNEDQINEPKYIETYGPGVQYEFKIEPVVNPTETETNWTTQTETRTTGFVLKQGSSGYLNIDVYRLTNNDWNDNETHSDWRDKAFNIDPTSKNEDAFYSGDFVFTVNGGATRCPYIGEETSMFFLPGTKFSNATLNMDVPKLDIDNHSVSNVPADESAYFNVKLWNDSEMNDGVSYIEKDYYLYLDPYSNPNGAVVTMDGVNLAYGQLIRLHHGETLNKVIQVKRGTSYDYDDLKLKFVPECDYEYSNTSNEAAVAFSVHYMPSSCDINITTPCDGWIMNTTSPVDSTGYYLPVVIDGYDVNYRNFDHIEFQYKLSTDSEDDWVNLMSYYANDSIYNAATGNKAKITSGRLSDIRFYGERDPMEQKYDLRAVSYCRLGSGFVSKSSKVLSGMKDTRCPEVFGYPEPADGILGVGQTISIPFSEDIAGNYLDEDANFQITGYTNSTSRSDATSLLFNGDEGQGAVSEAERSLTDKDFSVDLMVLPTTLKKEMTYFSHGTAKNNFTFGQTEDGRLFATLNGTRVTSNPMDETATAEGTESHSITAFTRLTVTYARQTGAVRFFMGNKELTSASSFLPANSGTQGTILWGNDFNNEHPYSGRMTEARLWTTLLSMGEITNYMKRSLNGYEKNLLAYYPMDEGQGYVANDDANGANLSINKATWNLPAGLALHCDGGEGIQLDGDRFAISELKDYTLGFWFKTEGDVANDQLQAIFASGYGTKEEVAPKGKIFIGLKGHNLMVRSNGFERTVNNDYADGEWHHFVMTVAHSSNAASIFVDNALTTTFAADSLNGLIASPNLYLGACHWNKTNDEDELVDQTDARCSFHGYIDDVAFWELALPKSYLNEIANRAPNGSEMGLISYLSFQHRSLNANSIYETTYNPYNAKVFYDDNNKAVNVQQRLVISDDALVAAMTTRTSAPITEQNELVKMNFSWMSRENQLVISLDKMADKEINKNNIFVVVRDVKDLRGNMLQNPVCWTVFVDRNQLRWGQKNVLISTEYGQGTIFQTTISNLCGTQTEYTIDNLPSWLTATTTRGTLLPTEEETVFFTVSENLDPGIYSEIIYLTDQNGLSEPLYIGLLVEAEEPNWTVSSDLSSTMNFVGQVNLTETVNGTDYTSIDTNPYDIVGAFINGECVGVQNISYNEVNGQSRVYMTIHGDDNSVGKQVHFRLWRAEKGIIYSLTPDQVVNFTIQGNMGTPDAPINLRMNNNGSQNITLNKGWNWISFNVDINENNEGLNGNSTGVYKFTENDIIKSDGQFSEYQNGQWIGTLQALDYHNIYMLKCGNAGTIEVIGSKLDKADKKLTLKQGWNYFPYLSNSTVPVTTALSNYYDAATPGDVIKSYDKFAMLDNNRHWQGSLTHMRAGEGYMLSRQGAGDFVFTFLDDNSNTQQIVARETMDDMSLDNDIHGIYSGNMPIVANVELPSELISAYDGSAALKLEAFSGDELVGRALPDGNSKYYLMTSALPGTELSFRIYDENGYELARTAPMVGYNETTSIGTVDCPFIIDFNGNGASATPTVFNDYIVVKAVAHSGDNIDIRLYNATGSLCFSHAGTASDSNYSYRLDHLAGLTPGVYVASIKVADHTYNIKLIKQ